MSNKNYPGNESFTITLTDLWYFSMRSFRKIQDKENQTLFTFLTTENLFGLPCSHECKHGAYSNLSSYAVNLPG